MNVTDTDLGTGVDLASAPVVCTGDSAWGLSGKPVYAHPAYADTGLGAESAYWELVGFYLVMSADFARGQEGDTESAGSADIGTGLDTGFVLTPIVNSFESGQGSEYFMVAIPVMAVSDSDAGIGNDTWLTHLTWADSDAGTGAEAQALGPMSGEHGSGQEGQAYVIEVFPYPPAWLFATPGGAYQLVWRPGTPEEKVISQFGQLNRVQMAEVADVIARLMDAEDMATISDSDSGGGKESNLPTANLLQLVVAPAVTCAQAGEASLVLLSGVSES